MSGLTEWQKRRGVTPPKPKTEKKTKKADKQAEK